MAAASVLGSVTKINKISSVLSCHQRIGVNSAGLLVIRLQNLHLSSDYGAIEKRPIISDIPKPPKRPLNPYVKYFNKNWHHLRDEGNYSVKRTTAEVAKNYKNINPDEKTKYESEYKSEREDYKQNFKTYMDDLTKDQKLRLSEYKKISRKLKAKRKLRQKMKMLEKPKRMRSAYCLFVQQQYINAGNDKSELSLKLLAEKWKNLSDDEKQVYREQSTDDLKRYKLELHEWTQKMKDEGYTDVTIHEKQVSDSKSAKKAKKSSAKISKTHKKKAKLSESISSDSDQNI